MSAVPWPLPSSLDSSLELVSSHLKATITIPLLTPPTDIGMLAPMIGSLAKSDKEIGARLGICFTFAGMYHLRLFALRIHVPFRFRRSHRYPDSRSAAFNALRVVETHSFLWTKRPHWNILFRHHSFPCGPTERDPNCLILWL